VNGREEIQEGVMMIVIKTDKGYLQYQFKKG
jgi:hypothetical protein